MWCFVTDESLDWGEIANVELEKYKAYSGGGMQEFFDREGGGGPRSFFSFFNTKWDGEYFQSYKFLGSSKAVKWDPVVARILVSDK